MYNKVSCLLCCNAIPKSEAEALEIRRRGRAGRRNLCGVAVGRIIRSNSGPDC